MDQNPIQQPAAQSGTPTGSGSGMSQKTILIIVIVVVALALIGWLARGFFGRNMAENAMERAMEQAGVNGDVDFDDNTWTYESDEGTFQAGEDVSLPSDWPGDVPVMSGVKISYAGSTNPQTGQAGASVMFTTSKSVSEVSAYYNSELVKEGWEIEGTANMGGTSIISANKGERSVGIYVAGAEGTTSVTIGVSE